MFPPSTVYRLCPASGLGGLGERQNTADTVGGNIFNRIP